MIFGFSQEVIEQLKYYVYRLIDPRTGNTFYVGKGNGNRVFAHANGVLKNYNGKDYSYEDEDDCSAKIKQIKEIISSGLNVIHIIHRYGLSEETAFEVEAALIDCYPGLTNIQSGHNSDRGVTNAEMLEKELSYEEFDEDNPEIKKLKYCIIKIKDYWIQQYGSIYETVRKYWRVNLDKVQKIPYVIASRDGVVVGVFEVDHWEKSSEVEGRSFFCGKDADAGITNLFINKRIPQHYIKKGKASPILYHDDIK